MEAARLDPFIDRVKHLPPSPRLLVKLLELFKHPDPDIDEVVGLISHDPAFTVEALRRCNSAFIGTEKPAEDMFEAVSRLGFQEIYEIVLAMFAAAALLPPGTKDGVHVEILWRHSVAVAVAARVLAQETGESLAAAFTAGLLHDIGKVVMVSAQRDDFAQAVLNAGLFHRPVVVTEREIFGFDHAQVGARLLTRWSLPPNIVAAVEHHHDPKSAGEFERLTAVVSVANFVAHGTGEKLGGDLKGAQVPNESMAVLELPMEKLVLMIPAMKEGLERAKKLMPA